MSDRLNKNEITNGNRGLESKLKPLTLNFCIQRNDGKEFDELLFDQSIIEDFIQKKLRKITSGTILLNQFNSVWIYRDFVFRKLEEFNSKFQFKKKICYHFRTTIIRYKNKYPTITVQLLTKKPLIKILTKEEEYNKLRNELRKNLSGEQLILNLLKVILNHFYEGHYGTKIELENDKDTINIISIDAINKNYNSKKRNVKYFRKEILKIKGNLKLELDFFKNQKNKKLKIEILAYSERYRVKFHSRILETNQKGGKSIFSNTSTKTPRQIQEEIEQEINRSRNTIRIPLNNFVKEALHPKNQIIPIAGGILLIKTTKIAKGFTTIFDNKKPVFTEINNIKVKSWVDGILIGTSTGQMKSAAARIIQNTPNHPLKKLLVNGKLKPSRLKGKDLEYYKNNPDILEMGHVRSRNLKEEDIIVLQSAYFNQKWGKDLERHGFIFMDEILIIGNIGVHKGTAHELLKAKKITEKDFNDALLFKVAAD